MGPDTTRRVFSKGCAGGLVLAKRAYNGVSVVSGGWVYWVEDGGEGFLTWSVGVFLRKRDFMAVGVRLAKLVEHSEIKGV
jgi:hypothetical protein